MVTSPAHATASAQLGRENRNTNTAVKDDWKAQKEEQAKLRKRQNDIAKIEKNIEQLETENSELDEQLALPEVYSDVKQLMKLNEKKQEIEKKLEKLYEDWEVLSADE